MKQYPTAEQIYAVLMSVNREEIPNFAGRTDEELWELAKKIKAEAVAERARREAQEES